MPRIVSTAPVTLGRNPPSGTAFVLRLRRVIEKLHQDAANFQRQAGTLTEELRRYKSTSRLVAPSVTGLILTAIFAALAGLLIGKFLL